MPRKTFMELSVDEFREVVHVRIRENPKDERSVDRLFQAVQRAYLAAKPDSPEDKHLGALMDVITTEFAPVGASM